MMKLRTPSRKKGHSIDLAFAEWRGPGRGRLSESSSELPALLVHFTEDI